jgi:restriction system protein
MLPLLKYANDNQEHEIKEAYEALANDFSLTQEERNELLPSGTQQVYKNRIGWAKTYLVKAGLLESKKRGYFNITERGREVLRENPEKIDNAFLKRFNEFNRFQKRKNTTANKKESVQTTATPEETIEAVITELNNNLATEILSYLKDTSSNYFEQIVVEVLVKMGYGGSRKEAGEVVGKSGDAGIDGIIKEDKLGLDAIYIQAKKWENPVSRPEIQKFVGALQGRRARKGIFITTSYFTKESIQYVETIESNVILIDGERFANLMIENEVGVSTINTYNVRRIDSDYFLEE